MMWCIERQEKSLVRTNYIVVDDYMILLTHILHECLDKKFFHHLISRTHRNTLDSSTISNGTHCTSLN
jgi:flagellar biosynthesis component FlhA